MEDGQKKLAIKNKYDFIKYNREQLRNKAVLQYSRTMRESASPLYGFVQLIDDGLQHRSVGGDVWPMETSSEER